VSHREQSLDLAGGKPQIRCPVLLQGGTTPEHVPRGAASISILGGTLTQLDEVLSSLV